MQFAVFMGLFFALLVIRVPIAVTAGLVAFAYIFITDSLPFTLPALTAYQSLDRFPLLAIPFFILAGQLMSLGGIARVILKFANLLIGNMTGGLAMVTIAASAMFADLSGSAPATVAAIGTLMIPAMIKQGYPADFAGAVAASAGVLALVIPPSNGMILYGLSANVSIARLFLAGFIPGLILTGCLLVTAYLICRHKGWQAKQARGTFRQVVSAGWEAKWAFLVPIILLGGIYSGIFTPTESAAVTCIYALIIGLFVYKEFRIRDLPRIMSKAIRIIVAIMFIVAMATIFGQVITIMGVPEQITTAMLSTSNNENVVMMLLNAMLLLVGCFMDGGAAIVILTPLLMVIAYHFNLDRVYFGVVIDTNLAIGTVTPPMGVNLFVANSICKVSPERIFVAAIPFVVALIIGLQIITMFPRLSLLIPQWFYGS